MAEWGIGDELDRTATQVRQRNAVHLLDEANTDAAGRYYLTACGSVLHAATGAVLTTYPASCWACVPGGVRRG